MGIVWQTWLKRAHGVVGDLGREKEGRKKGFGKRETKGGLSAGFGEKGRGGGGGWEDWE